MRVLSVVWLQQMSIPEGDQKEKGTGGREEAAKEGKGDDLRVGLLEKRPSPKTNVSASFHLRENSAWKISSILQSKP